MFKKVLFSIFTIFFIISQAYALEDYIVLSNKRIISVTSQNIDIVDVIPFFTIDNSKNIILVKPKQAGRTKIVFKFEDCEQTAQIKITENETIISDIDGLSYFVLDLPEGPLETLPPPSIRGGK